MSVRLRLQNMLETSVRPLLIMECQKGSTRDLLAGHIARAEDRVGVAVEQRAQQARVFGGVVFEVGVLDQREIAGGLVDGGAHRRALAAVALVPVETGSAGKPAASRCRMS